MEDATGQCGGMMETQLFWKEWTGGENGSNEKLGEGGDEGRG
jgi:hypothetical protein